MRSADEWLASSSGMPEDRFGDLVDLAFRGRVARALEAGLRTVRIDGDLLFGSATGLGLDTVLGEEVDDLAFGQCPLEAVRGPALLHEHAERDALHAEGLGKLLLDLGVDLAEDEGTAVFGRELLEHGRERLARVAPIRPEVEQDGRLHRALHHVLLERRDGDVLHIGSSHGASVGVRRLHVNEGTARMWLVVTQPLHGTPNGHRAGPPPQANTIPRVRHASCH